jgi:hypothetical protein
MGPTAKDFQQWTDATAELPWGAQRALYNTLELVRDEKISLTHGADYQDGTPCLINASANMLSSVNGEGGHGKPSLHFHEVVASFDNLNRLLYTSHVNLEHNKVSPLAAEFLLHNFAPLKEKPVETAAEEILLNEAFAEGISVEPTDEEFTRDWLNALSSIAPEMDYTNGATSESRETEVRESGAEVTSDVKRKTS